MAEIDGGLRSLFRTRLKKGIHWQSIETGGTGLGIPDANFKIKGSYTEGWIEYKQTDGWTVGLSAEQVGWHLRRRSVGGRTLVATRRWHDGGPRKGPAVDELWIHMGSFAAELAESGLRCDVGRAPLGVGRASRVVNYRRRIQYERYQEYQDDEAVVQFLRENHQTARNT